MEKRGVIDENTPEPEKIYKEAGDKDNAASKLQKTAQAEEQDNTKDE